LECEFLTAEFVNYLKCRAFNECNNFRVVFNKMDSFGWNSILLNKFILHNQKTNIKGFYFLVIIIIIIIIINEND